MSANRHSQRRAQFRTDVIYSQHIQFMTQEINYEQRSNRR